MSKLTRRTVILAKKNTGDYGVDPNPTAAENGILCNMTPSITPQGETIERNPVRDTMSPLGQVVSAKNYSLELECELKGGDVDGSGVVQAPEYEPLLLASGLQKEIGDKLKVTSSDDVSSFQLGEYVTGGTSDATGKVVQIIGTTGGILVLAHISGTFEDTEDVTGDSSGASATVDGAPEDAVIYRPESDPDQVPDCGIYYHVDGIRHKALGAIGDMSLNLEVNSVPSISFTMSSLYNTPTDQSLPTPSLLDLFPPVATNLGLKVGGYSPVGANALTLSMNADVTQLSDLNAKDGIKAYRITGRNPSGSLDPEVDSLANFDPFTAWENSNPGALTASVGSTAGNRAGLFVPKSLYTQVQYNDRNGYQTYSLPFLCRADDLSVDGGDDEFYLVYT